MLLIDSDSNKFYIFRRYRPDGKLLVVGGESGLIQILDATSRSILRNFQGHTKATHVCCFGKDASQILSASDDKTVRCWDLASQKEASMIKPAHKDYIRCGCTCETNSQYFITGSYDHTVKVWDLRSSTTAMEMNHGAPVECVLMHPNGSVCLSAGSNNIKVWDMLAGGKLFHHFSNHQKTITSLRYDSDCRRLLSASLDRRVKVYDARDNYAVIANIEYPSPILSMDISKDDQHLVVGMSDGAISLRHRPKAKTGEAVTKMKRPLHPGTRQYKHRNQNSQPDADSMVVPDKKNKKFSEPDNLLRKFRHHDALDAVLQPGLATSYVISFLLELSRRDALQLALTKRTSKSLTPMFQFLTKNIADPRYAKQLIPIANLVLDMYPHLIGQDFTFDRSVTALSCKLTETLVYQKAMIQLSGALEQIFSIASPAPDVGEIRCSVDLASLPDVNGTDNINGIGDVVAMEVDDVKRKRKKVASDSSVVVNGHGKPLTNGHHHHDDEVDFVIGASTVA